MRKNGLFGVVGTMTVQEKQQFYEKVGEAQRRLKARLTERQQIYIAERVKAGLPLTVRALEAEA